LLRNKLYNNPINSVVRELTSNAYDANVENKNEHIPVVISLPGEYLIIKDDGVGLSADRLQNVFCVYGESTKRDSDDFIGGYGLGGKSVFAYSQSFHIE